MLIFEKLLEPFRYRQSLDILLRGAPAETAELRVRVEWLGKLVNWVRTVRSNGSDGVALVAERIPTAKLKYILQILDRDPLLKTKVSAALQSILRDTRALELFMDIGVPNQIGFIGEFMERCNRLLLPQAPNDRDLISVFSETFRFESDADWIYFMDPAVFNGWVELFTKSKEETTPSWSNLAGDAEDALFLLVETVKSIGLSRLVRNRVQETDFHQLPFSDLSEKTRMFLQYRGAERRASEEALLKTLDRCFDTLTEVQAHFRKHGASLALIYQANRLEALMRRIEVLIRLLLSQDRAPDHAQNSQIAGEFPQNFVQQFLSLLVRENLHSRKITQLFKENLVLISQKIVETNSETGEHYITRDRKHHWAILSRSFGGGVLTGFTALIKCLLYLVIAPPFIMGLFSFANYGVSFLGLQALDFTLATKQPAMTASSLASKLEDANGSITPLIEELIHLVRSQISTIFGNILGVVPMVILLDLLFSTFGTHMLDLEHAEHTMQGFSVLGMTPFYAAGTGVLLWLSSLFSGWFANWFSFHRLPEAIEHHPRLRYVVGAQKAKSISDFFKRNVAGIAANVSLAFLLAMTPPLASFFGFPFDARHVTLSTGALTASAMAIGVSVFSKSMFWLAIGGIISMGIFNLSIAFALALTVAIWAKEISAPRRGVIYRALLKEFMSRPWVFFFPPRD